MQLLHDVADAAVVDSSAGFSPLPLILPATAVLAG